MAAERAHGRVGIPLGGWRSCLATAAGLALGPAVALGLARFAYSLLLPALRSDRHWSFAQAGAMNTANAVGYLAGAIGAGPRVVRAGSRRTYLAGIGLTALALLAVATLVTCIQRTVPEAGPIAQSGCERGGQRHAAR